MRLHKTFEKSEKPVPSHFQMNLKVKTILIHNAEFSMNLSQIN